VKPRAQPTPAPVVVDEIAAAARYRSLSIWVQLTVAGQGVQIEHRGSLSDRLAHLEQQIDAQGLRAQAEQHLASLEASARRTRKHIADLRRAG
jgi:hypothetical protein